MKMCELTVIAPGMAVRWCSPRPVLPGADFLTFASVCGRDCFLELFYHTLLSYVFSSAVSPVSLPRLYLEEKLNQSGAFSAELDADAAELATILCLGARETQGLRDEASAKLYRRLLRDEVTSGR